MSGAADDIEPAIPTRATPSEEEVEDRERVEPLEVGRYTSFSTIMPIDEKLREEEDVQKPDPWSLYSILLVLSLISLSSAVIVFNKYILDNAGFKYPITLTCWHLTFAAAMTQILAHTTTLIDGRHTIRLTWREYTVKIIPIGFMYSGSLACSNIPYMTLSVAFIQMLKGLGPAVVLFAMWTLRLTTTNLRIWLNIAVIVLGVIVTGYGEIHFVLSGFLYQCAGLLFEAYRLAMIQQLLSNDKKKMDPLVSLYYFAPVCALMLGIVALITEMPRLKRDEVVKLGPTMLVANASLAFSLNVVGVMLIGRTSALMLPLSGILKSIAVIFASVLLWSTIVTPLQLLGCSISTIGLLYHSVGTDRLHELVLSLVHLQKRKQTTPFSRRARIRHVLDFLVAMVVVAGAVGGWYAGYHVERGPRTYWDSLRKLTNGVSH